VSPRFAYGLDEYAGVFQVWRPKTFKPIEIKYREINSPDHRAEPRAVGQAFSGGVDSFFTLWSHLPDNMQLQDFQVTHGIFTQGVDFELYETETYVSTYKKLGRLFKDLGLTLIPAATNYRDFWRYRLGWDIM
jgi:hypothetical protein